MANIQKTIEIIFGITDNGFTSGIGKFDSALQGVADPVANFTTDLLKTEAAIAAAGAALLGFSINEAGQFKGSIGEIAALFNATAEESALLGDSILKFSKDSVFSIDDINAATFTAISTGTEWTEVTEQLTVSQKLAVAGSSSLAVATAALSRTMNAYGLEASEAERVSDALFVAAQLGDTNLTILGNTFGNLAATASASSVGLEEALAAVSALTVGGIKTTESMTILKALFRELATPSKELSTALGGLNLESDGLQVVMQKLLEVTGGSQAKMDALFSSSEAVAGAIILSKDSVGAFNTALVELEDKAGKVTAAYNLMAEDFTKVNQRLANNLSVVLIEIGDDLLNEYGSIANALSSIFDSIGVSLDEGTLGILTATIESFAQDMATTIEGIATALPEALEQLDFTGLLQSFSELTAQFGGVFDTIFGGDLDLSKPEDLAQALQTAVNLMSKFVDLTKGIITQFQPIFDAIGAAGQSIEGVSDKTANTTGELLGAITLIGNFGTALGALLLVIGNSDIEFLTIVDVMVGGVTVLVNTFQIGFGAIAAAVSLNLSLLADAAAKLTFGETSQGFKDMADGLRETSESLQGGLVDDINELQEGMALVSGEASLFSTEIVKSATASKEVRQETVKLTDELKKAGFALDESGNLFLELSDNQGKVVTSSKELVVANKATNEELKINADVMQQAAENLISYDEQLALNAKLTENAAKAVIDYTKAFDGSEEAIGDMERAILAAELAGQEYEVTLVDGEEVLTVYKTAIDAAKTGLDNKNEALAKTTKATDEAADALDGLSESEKLAIQNTHDMEKTLAELASSNFQKALEVTASIKIAELEADAEKVKSIMSAVEAAYESTASTIESLVLGFDAAFTDEDREFFKDQIRQQVERQKALDEQLIELQKAQVEKLLAEAKALGEGVDIFIKADGMEREIEAFMFEILKRIQTKVAGDKASFLLGS